MKRVVIYSLFACAMTFMSCKKNKLPEREVENSPVFYLKGEINGVPVNISAGVNDYYMNASFYQDANNVYVYKGELKQKNCSGCGLGLTILINDYKFSAANSVLQVDSGLKAGTYHFNLGDTNPTQYVGKFTPLNAASGTMYDWQCDPSGWTSSQEQPTWTLDANKTYSIKLKSSDVQGCQNSLTNVFKVGSPVQTGIKASYSSSGYRFSVDSDLKGLAPYTYLWDFNDGDTSADSSPTHAFAQQGEYTVKLTLTDANNETCTSYYQVNTNGKCEANFAVKFTPVQNVDALSGITVQVTDQNGVAYASNALQQSAGSRFDIVSVEDYGTNERGEPTKKLKIKFSCSLSGSSGPITITNGEAVIAVSYK